MLKEVNFHVKQTFIICHTSFVSSTVCVFNYATIFIEHIKKEKSEKRNGRNILVHSSHIEFKMENLQSVNFHRNDIKWLLFETNFIFKFVDWDFFLVEIMITHQLISIPNK